MKCRAAVVAIVAWAFVGHAHAQGFQLQQYEPVAAGERGFVAAAPWYSDTRPFAAALTLNYGHDVLQGGRIKNDEFEGVSIVDHQWTGHIDVAYAPWTRLQLSLSLPVTLAEAGQARLNVGPASTPAMGDPRLGATVRLMGNAQRDGFSAHAHGALWIPIDAEDDHAGDQAVRGRLSAIFAGYALRNLSWSSNFAVLLRKQAGLNAISSGPGTVGNELQAAAAVGYASSDHRLNVGPEVAFGTVLNDGRGFSQEASHLEAFLSGTYWVGDSWQLGAAAGVGIVRTPGTPDGRGLLRVAYAPYASQRAEPAKVEVVAQAEPVPLPAEPAPAEPTSLPPPPAAAIEPEPEAVAQAAVVTAPAPASTAPALADLPTIDFAKNRDIPRDEEALARAAAILQAHPELTKIRVIGHSDDTGPAELNLTLSRSRARNVATYLTEHGVPAEKVEVRGVGSAQPVSSGTDDAARAKNRRVEIVPSAQ